MTGNCMYLSASHKDTLIRVDTETNAHSIPHLLILEALIWIRRVIFRRQEYIAGQRAVLETLLLNPSFC